MSTSAPHLPLRRPRRIPGVILLTTAFATVLAAFVVVDSAGSASAASIVHVSIDGRPGADGSASDPVSTIARAVQLAGDGDTVLIRSGRYHEQVQVYEKQVHLVAAPHADVVLDGSSQVHEWTSADGDWWAPWGTERARAAAPFTTQDKPEAGWPEQLFVDGVPLDQVSSRAALAPGAFFHDLAADRLWIAEDPAGHDVEASDLGWGLYLNRAHGSSVTGLTVRRYATQTSEMAAFRAYADDLTIEGVTVSDNARIGLSVIGRNARLRHVTATGNGHLGLHGHLSVDLRISDSTVVANNRAGFDAHHSAGGIKVTETDGLVVERSYVAGNDGPGVWTDLSVTNTVVRGNRIVANSRSGVELELSSGAVVVDNVVLDNGEAGIWVLESTDVEVWHNAAYGNVRDIWVEDGPRSDVADVAIFNNLLGGTDRSDGVSAILNVDDWTEVRSAADMRVRTGSNRFWLVPGSSTTLISRWANWPAALGYAGDIAEHRAGTGQGVDSDVVHSSIDPFRRAAGDERQPSAAPSAATMPGAVAVAAAWSERAAPAGPLTTAAIAQPSVDPDDPTDDPAIDPPTSPPTGPPTGPPTVPPTSPATTHGGTNEAAVVEQPATRIRMPGAPVELVRVSDRFDTPNRVEAQTATPNAQTRTVATTASIDGAHTATVHGWTTFVAMVDDLISA